MWMFEGICHIIGCHNELALANCEGKTPRCPRCVHLLLMLCINFDICNDALWGLMNSLVGHEGPKFAFVKVFHVQFCCTLVGQMLFCFNQSGHENELSLRVVGTDLMCAVGSMLFPLEAEGDPKVALGNLGPLMPGLPQSVP
jgi:hypothetical protein